MATVDLVMEYLKWRNRILDSISLKLFYDFETLMSMGIIELYESMAVRVRIDMEYELHYFRDVEKPASWVNRIVFYDFAQPVRPKYPTFINDKQEFPLRHSIEIFTCPTCGGSGQVPCPSCDGTGKVTCPECYGSGICRKCDGAGQLICSRCDGTGSVYATRTVERTCPVCEGRGYIYNVWGERRVCPRCFGAGVLVGLAKVKVTCPRCLGSGRVVCDRCFGTGKCVKCGGTGLVTCPTCRGTGYVICSRCNGEGRLLSFTKEIYEYIHRYRIEDVIPELPEKMVEIYHKTVPQGSLKLKKWDIQEVIRFLEMFNKHVEDQYHKAEAARNALINDLRNRGGDVLYHDETFYITPLGYLNISFGKKREQFWYIGTRGKHIVLPLRPPLNPMKVTYFFLFMLGLINLISLFIVRSNLFSFIGLNFLNNFVVSFLLAALASLAEVKILRSRLEMERTVLITGPTKTGKTTYFTLLTLYISKMRLGEVVDQYYPIFVKILTGEMPHRNISLTCLIKMKEGYYLRLIDLKSKSYETLDNDFTSAVKYAECVLILQNPSAIDKNLHKAINRIRSVNPRAKIVVCYNADVGKRDKTVIPIWKIREEYINGLTTEDMKILLIPIEMLSQA